MLTKYKNYILLHTTVLIWGFTGVIGRYLQDSTSPVINAFDIVWNRMYIAVAAMLLMWWYVRYIQKKQVGKPWSIGTYGYATLLGAIITAHWLTFFLAIHLSNISIALVCMSTSTFFTSLLEPILLKKKFDYREGMMGVLVIIGVGFIFEGVSSEYNSAIAIGVFSAILSALFSVLNAKMVRNYSALKASTVQLFTGFLLLSAYLFVKDSAIPITFFSYEFNYMVAILFLGTICTAWAFLVSANVMKELSPFTVVLAINMEPIYAIIMALIFYSESETMPPKFYFGAAIVIGVIMLNGVIKGGRKKVA
ncbi:MAG: DMT family transporter [Bacteroidia bacterium]